MFAQQLYHSLVKTIQVCKEIICIVHQIPLTTRVLMTPTITLTREINPLGVTELISHKCEISTIDSRSCDETNHLMQRYTTVHHISGMTMLKMPIHICVHKTEDNRLIAHQSLIMTLGITNRFLILTAVRHLVKDMTRFPILILHLLDILNPEIRNTHRQTIIKSHTSVFYCRSQTRHTTHLFGYTNSIGLHLVNNLVGQSEIHNRIAILITIEITGITIKILTQTMTLV